VSGYFVVDGKKVSGDRPGIRRHGHANLPFNRHMTAWEGFIAFTWEPVGGHMWSITVFDYVAHEEFGGGRMATLAITKDDKIVDATPLYDIQGGDWRKDSKFNIDFPWRYTVKTTGGGCSLSGVSIAKGTWETLDILANCRITSDPLF